MRAGEPFANAALHILQHALYPSGCARSELFGIVLGYQCILDIHCAETGRKKQQFPLVAPILRELGACEEETETSE